MNIQDVAKKAGVSVATISRVLNNDPKVRQQTKEKVLQVIKELNYQPNLLARNLRRAETKRILLITPSTTNPFHGYIFKGIEDVANENGYSVMLCNTKMDKTRELGYLEMLKNRLADGVIYLATTLQGDELTQLAKEYPVVLCAENTCGANAQSVLIDNLNASYTAVKYLIEKGHKDIALITVKNEFETTLLRKQGYAKALSGSGIPIDESLVKFGDYGFESGYKCTMELLKSNKKPSAIFCVNDVMGIGAIRAAKDLNLEIPKDVAVIGFDDIEYSSYHSPGLTTIHQPKYEMGTLSMQLILKQINGNLSAIENGVLEHHLIEREST